MDIKNIDPAQLAWLVQGRETKNLNDALFKYSTLMDIWTAILQMMYANAKIHQLRNGGETNGLVQE